MLNYIALILLYINQSKGETEVDISILVIFVILIFLVTILDYTLPLLEVQKFGASRTGMAGAVVGMLIGIVFSPLLGILVGRLRGAFIGELIDIAGKDQYQACRIGVATFLGSLASLAVKLV